MHPLIILLVLLFGLFYSYIAYQTWRENAMCFRGTILLLTIALAWLSITYAFELLSLSLNEMLLMNDLEYLSYVTLPTLFTFFILSYIGKDHLINKRTILTASIIPLFILIMVWTNDFHHLYYLSVNAGTESGVNEIVTNKGPIFFLYAAYTYVVLSIGVFFLLTSMKDAPQYRRKQTLAILFACFIPAIASVLQLGGLIPLPLGFVVIISYYFCGIIFYTGALRAEVFVLVPVASTTIVENMKDLAIATDIKGKVVRVNPASEAFFGLKAKMILGKEITSLFPRIEERTFLDGKPVVISINGEDRYYHVQINRLDLPNGHQIGILYIFRDITELEKAREDLRMANIKLNLISNITRHDMLNQLVVVRGFSNLLNDQPLQGKGERYLEGINSAVITMEHLIDFARDYQKFGLETPAWNNLDNILAKAKINIADDSVRITNADHVTELFFDQMLEKVFYNLIDNSLRHGGEVKNIRIGTQQQGRGLLIIFEDDGVGIPDGEKARIFQWGFGKNTGLGLAMCQQILSLSNWSIVENGVPGKGARFEISVPEKDWRAG